MSKETTQYPTTDGFNKLLQNKMPVFKTLNAQKTDNKKNRNYGIIYIDPFSEYEVNQAIESFKKSRSGERSNLQKFSSEYNNQGVISSEIKQSIPSKGLVDFMKKIWKSTALYRERQRQRTLNEQVQTFITPKQMASITQKRINDARRANTEQLKREMF